MLSFWEQDVFLAYDSIIVGGGLVGLSTALSLKEADPKQKIAVFERGLFPTGASTKNAGFACFGSLTELLDDLKNASEPDVIDLVKERFEGLKLLRERLGDEAIDYQGLGGYELIAKKDKGSLDQLAGLNDMLRLYFGADVFENQPELLQGFGFDGDFETVVINHFEGQIHTGKMMQALAHKCRSAGIEIFTTSTVDEIKEEGNSAAVVVRQTKDDIVFRAKRVICCTNAFTKRLLPGLEVEPGRGLILATSPIIDLKFKGSFHMDRGYYYFRNYGDRVIFGGGRNLDFEGENSTEFKVNPKILETLKTKLQEVILPNSTFEIEHTWTGIMAFGPTKQPIVKQVSPSVYTGVRLGGMGVALGSAVGKELTELVIEGKL